MNHKYLLLSATALLGGLLAAPAETKAQVSFKSISVGASYYKPSLDYWNKRSILTDYNAGKGATFSSGVMPTAAIEIGLVKGLSLGGRVGYWKQSVSSDLTIAGINRSEKLTLSIIPVSLDLKYSFGGDSAAKTPFLTPYIGVSVARYFINNDFSRQVVNNTGSLSESQAGNTYGMQLFVGAEKKLVKKLYLALDVRYHFGNYNQSVRAETTSTLEKVSLDGLEAGLSLRLKLR